MKEYITRKQWEALASEKQEKLISLLTGNTELKEVIAEDYSKCFTIAKMIEILGDRLYTMTRNEYTNGWYVILGQWNGLRIDGLELVDCLWTAIKRETNYI